MYYYPSNFQNFRERVRKNKDEIHVIGEGSVSVEPDKADVTLGVGTEDKELKKAQAENSMIISQVIQSLNEIGIGNESIQTIEYSIYPIYDFIDGQQSFRAYRVNHMLSIEIYNTENVGPVVDTAVNSGANNVSNISFSMANSEGVYQQALTMAVENAILKANTIANALRVVLIGTPVKIIEELIHQTVSIPYGETSMVKGVTTTQIRPGTRDIRARIRAVFRYMS